MHQPHAAQHVWCLGELDVVVADDLYPVAPRVEKVEKPARQRLDTRLGQRLADCFLVVDHESEMATVIGRLRSAFLQREELVAEIDEGRSAALAAKLEVEQATVERQRLFDIADLEGDMIEADCACFFCI